jgi:hypothetical protein
VKGNKLFEFGTWPKPHFWKWEQVWKLQQHRFERGGDSESKPTIKMHPPTQAGLFINLDLAKTYQISGVACGNLGKA